MAAVTQDYVSGYLGNLSADGTDLHCEGWDAELSNPSFDATNTESGGYQKRGRTITSMNGSATVKWKTTSGKPNVAVGSIYPLILTATTGQTYEFNGYIAGIGVAVPVRGGVTFRVAFESDGAITLPT